MKKFFFFFSSIVLAVIFTCISPAQAQEGKLFQALAIKPGVGFEYFSRSIRWDGNGHHSNLKTYFFTFETEVQFRKGLLVSAALGYSLSNYDNLIFRQLPVSVVLDVGNINGFVLGSAIRKRVFNAEQLQIDAQGQFYFYLGNKQEWEIPDLAVEGKVEGKPHWMRFSIGPVITYMGFAQFFPYLYLGYNKIWGRFKMDETIEDLTGSENKKIRGDGSFSTSFGFTFEPSSRLSFKAEASLIPHAEGVDLGFLVKAMVIF